jgi:hypothetical protein
MVDYIGGFVTGESSIHRNAHESGLWEGKVVFDELMAVVPHESDSNGV